MTTPSTYSLAILGALQHKPEGAVYTGSARMRLARRRTPAAVLRRRRHVALVARRSATVKGAAA